MVDERSSTRGEDGSEKGGLFSVKEIYIGERETEFSHLNIKIYHLIPLILYISVLPHSFNFIYIALFCTTSYIIYSHYYTN